jgi:hypothetical protein
MFHTIQYFLMYFLFIFLFNSRVISTFCFIDMNDPQLTYRNTIIKSIMRKYKKIRKSTQNFDWTIVEGIIAPFHSFQ